MPASQYSSRRPGWSVVHRVEPRQSYQECARPAHPGATQGFRLAYRLTTYAVRRRRVHQLRPSRQRRAGRGSEGVGREPPPRARGPRRRSCSARSPHIWRDPKLQGNDFFADTLVERLQRVARARHGRLAALREVGVDDARAERVLARRRGAGRRPRRRQGARLQGAEDARAARAARRRSCSTLLGYEFFKIDPETGKVRELDEVFGPEAQREFWLKLDDLAHDIVRPARGDRLESDADAAGRHGANALPPRAAPIAAAPPRRVYLAETTSDLREQREAIRRDLQQHGYTVLPDRPLPHVVDGRAAAVRDDLAACRMSIHLIGRTYGLVPEGGVQSLVEIQNELAIERAAPGGFSRLLWIPTGLDRSTTSGSGRSSSALRMDPRHRDERRPPRDARSRICAP